MRNRTTDSMATAMNRAFDKSGMTLKEFVTHIGTTRDIFDYKVDENYVSFHVMKDCQVYQFYFVFDEWYCKQ